MISWIQLGTETQLRVLSLIRSLVSKQIDPEMEVGLIAAISELEMWSGSPNYDSNTGEYISEAVEQDSND